MSFLSIEKKSGPPIRTASITVIPYSQSIRLNWPGRLGGLIWNRPTAIYIQHMVGKEYAIPIRNVTRQIIIFLITTSLVTFIIALFFRKRL